MNPHGELLQLSGSFGDKPDPEELGFSPLHTAVIHFEGAPEFEEALIKTPRSEINTLDRLGYSPLQWAARYLDAWKMRQLLYRGADPNLRSIWGVSVVCEALCGNYGAEECLHILHEAGADFMNVDQYGKSAIHFAALFCLSEDAMNMCLQICGNVNLKDVEGDTPLMFIAMNSDSSATSIMRSIRWLLSKGADTETRNSSNRRAVDTAILLNCHAQLRVLLDHYSEWESTVECTKGMSLSKLALHADIETLRILQHASLDWTDTSPGDWEKTGDSAVYRRDKNEEWADGCAEPPDESPAAWFTVFMELWEEIGEQQELGAVRRVVNGELEWAPDGDDEDNSRQVVPGSFPEDS